jgi:hypothetical protein
MDTQITRQLWVERRREQMTLLHGHDPTGDPMLGHGS